MSLRGLIKFFFSIAISLLIGWWAYLQSGSPSITSIRLPSWYGVFLTSCLIVVGSGARSWRLSHLFLSSYVQIRKTFKALFFTISFSFLLGGIGFLARIFILRRAIGVRHVVSLGVIGVEKFFDFSLAFIVFFFLLPLPNSENSMILSIYENRIVALILLLIFLAWFYFHQGKVFRFLLALIHWLFRILPFPRSYYYFCKRQVFYLYKSLDSLPGSRIGLFLIHSPIVFIVESAFYYFSLRLLGVDIEWSQALLLNAVILLALLVPIFPSGIGLFQAAIVLILGGEGFYVSLLIHFLMITTHLVIVSLGLYQFFEYFKLPFVKFKLSRNFLEKK